MSGISIMFITVTINQKRYIFLFCSNQNENKVMESGDKLNDQKETIKKELYSVVDQTFPPLVIRYLLVLQSTFSTDALQPKANSEVC